jgi:hypothetical protein
MCPVFLGQGGNHGGYRGGSALLVRVRLVVPYSLEGLTSLTPSRTGSTLERNSCFGERGSEQGI